MRHAQQTLWEGARVRGGARRCGGICGAVSLRAYQPAAGERVGIVVTSGILRCEIRLS